MKLKEEIRKYLWTNENGNIAFQNLWDAAKAVLRGTFIATSGLPQENKKNLNLTYHLREIEKEEQTKPKVRRRKEI